MMMAFGLMPDGGGCHLIAQTISLAAAVFARVAKAGPP
jgi:hypothetical protein